MIPSLLLIMPCYNEEEILKSSIDKTTSLLNQLIEENLISEKSRLLFIDDGSKDNTWKILTENAIINNKISALKLSRNFGHQNALLAGLLNYKNMYDIYLTLDVDLQDDINIIPEMIQSYKKGNQIVYAVRNNRDVDSYFKRKSAELFYKLQKILGIKTIDNHADFRLISNNILIQLEKFKEINLFLRAIFPLIGFKHDIIYYKRQERSAGNTKYPFFKMLIFAIDGISSFSIKPLRIILILGIIIFGFSLFMSLWIFYGVLFTNATVPGWASTVLPIYFIGGIQLFSLGVIGEYIGKIFIESKSRPRYIIEEEL